MYIIPKKFNGEVYILYNCKNGSKFINQEGYKVYQVPENGVILVNGDREIGWQFRSDKYIMEGEKNPLDLLTIHEFKEKGLSQGVVAQSVGSVSINSKNDDMFKKSINIVYERLIVIQSLKDLETTQNIGSITNHFYRLCYAKTLKKDSLFRVGLLFKYFILDDKANLNSNLKECLTLMESKKDFKEFEGYFRLFQLYAEGSKDGPKSDSRSLGNFSSEF